MHLPEKRLLINDLCDDLFEELSDEGCETLVGGGLWSSFRTAVRNKKDAIVSTVQGLLQGQLPSGQTAAHLLTPIDLATLENWTHGG